jgi:hypothetical protein
MLPYLINLFKLFHLTMLVVDLNKICCKSRTKVFFLKNPRKNGNHFLFEAISEASDKGYFRFYSTDLERAGVNEPKTTLPPTNPTTTFV